MNLRPGTFLSSYDVDMLVEVMELTGEKADDDVRDREWFARPMLVS